MERLELFRGLGERTVWTTGWLRIGLVSVKETTHRPERATTPSVTCMTNGKGVEER
jgi:hypothetical protein